MALLFKLTRRHDDNVDGNLEIIKCEAHLDLLGAARGGEGHHDQQINVASDLSGAAGV
jgi:hypothetical protein